LVLGSAGACLVQWAGIMNTIPASLLWLIAMIACIVASFKTWRQEHQKNQKLIKKSFYVVSARWGIWNNFPPINNGFPPVIDIVRNRIKDSKLNIRCEVHVLGDPHERVHKLLIIEYLYAGEKREVTFNEGQEVNLP